MVEGGWRERPSEEVLREWGDLSMEKDVEN